LGSLTLAATLAPFFGIAATAVPAAAAAAAASRPKQTSSSTPSAASQSQPTTSTPQGLQGAGAQSTSSSTAPGSGAGAGQSSPHPDSSQRKRDASPSDSPSNKAAKIRKIGSGSADKQSDQEAAPAQMKRILDLIDGFRKSKVLFAACELGVFDVLAAKGQLSASQLAVETKSDVDRLSRLLDACVSLELLTKRTTLNKASSTVGASLYDNSQLARLFLANNSPYPLKEHVICNDLVDFPLWSHLLSVVKDNDTAVVSTFGLAREEHVLDAVFDTDVLRDRFINSQDVLSRVASQHIVSNLDLTRYMPAGNGPCHIVEIGNLAGQLSLAAMERFPNMRATIISRLLTDTNNYPPDILSRVQFVHGNSLDINQIPVADVFVLTGVLPPLPQDKAYTLLRRVRQCLPLHGGILLQEKVLRSNAVSVSTHVQDLNTLVRSSAGRCRRFEDIERDLKSCGFAHVELHHTHLPVDVVVASPDPNQP